MDELEIRWLRTALSNLDDIATYIAQDNPAAAARIVSRLKEAVQRLQSNPDMGRSGLVVGTRELVVPGTPFVVVYAHHKRAIVVLRVYHGARKWPDHF
jgi:toxin ParE1/3/4